MNTRRPTFIYLMGSIVLLITAFIMTSCLSPPMQRQPEISLARIKQTFVGVLGKEWEIDPSEQQDIRTDTDSTSATWAVFTGFRDRKHPLDHIYLEIHVFRNSYVAAHQLLPASPIWSYMKSPFYPAGWDYRPPHAESFRIACEEVELVKKRVYCTAEMRYEEYVLYLQAHITSSFSLDELKVLLSATDKYMFEFLNSSTLAPGPRLLPTAIKKDSDLGSSN